ncbi:MAG: hypothetical protein QW802_04695 [Candidatus Altiarchaeota archaeon]
MKFKLLKYLKFLGKDNIIRRYFVMNSFDGALTILGLLIALFFANVKEAKIIVVSCLGAGIAMFVSGIYGAYAAERAERLRELKELEKHLMTDLDETKIGRKLAQVSILVALVDGLSPFLVSLLLSMPFILSSMNFFSLEYGFFISFMLILSMLFSLGFIVGKIAVENPIKEGIKTLSAGIIVGMLLFILEFLKVI